MKLTLMTFILLTASIGFSNESTNNSALLDECLSGSNQAAYTLCLDITKTGEFNVKAHSMCRSLGEDNIYEMAACLYTIKNKSYSQVETSECSGARNGDLQVDCLNRNGSKINADQSNGLNTQTPLYDEDELGPHRYKQETEN